MKKIFLYTVCICFLANCSGDSDPKQSKTEKVTALLTSGTWSLQTVLVDGIDQTEIYEDLTLTFTEDAITSTNGRVVWAESDTWQFTDDTATEIERGDGLHITLEEISNNTLVLTLTWDDTTFETGGRTSSLAGVHTFTFDQ
jgi:hypothetical protein